MLNTRSCPLTRLLVPPFYLGRLACVLVRNVVRTERKMVLSVVAQLDENK
jgi:hypothetical protein